MSSVAVKRSPHDWPAIVAGVLWFLTHVLVRVVPKGEGPDTWQRASIALLPVPVFAVFLWRVLTGVRSLDGLERRIHLEAPAMCHPPTLLLITILGLMQRAVTLELEDWSDLHIWPHLIRFHVAGPVVSTRRYR